MMHYQRRCRLLRLEQKPRSQPHPHILLRLQQRKQLRLVLQIRASRIPKRTPRPTILLMKQIANRRSILARNPQLFAHSLVMQLRESRRGLHTKPMKIQILRILPALKQFLCLYGSLGSNGNQRKPNHIHLPGSLRSKEIRNTKSASLPLPRKSKSQKFRSAGVPPAVAGASRSRTVRLIYDNIVPFTQTRKIPVNDFRLKQPSRSHFLLNLLLDRTKLLFHQPHVIRLRSRLQLPLILEKRSLIDIRKNIPYVVLLHPHSPKRRRRNIRSISHHRAPLRKYRPSLFIHRL